jgi:hypothetical protein
VDCNLRENEGVKRDGSFVTLHARFTGRRPAVDRPIQPLTIIHADRYLDYSHGVRLVSREVAVDGKAMDIGDVLKNRELCILLSDEGPMEIAGMYVAGPATAPTTEPYAGRIAARPAGRFGTES